MTTQNKAKKVATQDTNNKQAQGKEGIDYVRYKSNY